MKELLKDLAEVLEKHGATILVPAIAYQTVVVSMFNYLDDTWEEVAFKEEISADDIRFNNYEQCILPWKDKS